MVVPRLKASNVRAGGSAALAVAVMAALVAAPTAERQIPNEIHQVQLTAAVLGAVIDDKDMEVQIVVGEIGDDLVYACLFIVGGNDHQHR